MEEKDKHLAYAILEHFERQIKDGKLPPDDVETLEVAIQCISEVYHVQTSNQAHRDLYNTQPATLSLIFDMYLKTKDKLKVLSHN